MTALPDEAKGLYFCSTARHGGLWLSNAWIKKLPKDYCEYIGNRRWAEEDCDCADVLQIFGFLSLVSEPTELHITQADIEKGKETRVDYRDRPMTDKYFEEGWVGGPIAEAFKRQTGCTYDMINTDRVLQAAPGIWKYCRMPENGTALNKAFDAGEAVEPTTLLLEPYDYVPYRKRLNERITLIETRHTNEDHSESAESGELFTLPTWREKLDAEDVISALEASEKKLPFQLSELSFTEETADHFLTEARSSYNEGDLPYTYSIYSKGIYAYELGYQTPERWKCVIIRNHGHILENPHAMVGMRICKKVWRWDFTIEKVSKPYFYPYAVCLDHQERPRPLGYLLRPERRAYR